MIQIHNVCFLQFICMVNIPEQLFLLSPRKVVSKIYICNVQRLQKLIYLHLSTDCFMKISLH